MKVSMAYKEEGKGFKGRSGNGKVWT